MGGGTAIAGAVKRTLSRLLDFSLYGAIAVLVVLFVSRKLSGPKQGQVAAAFDLPVVDRPGERFRLADHRGKPVVIEVFASWCGACRRAAPTLTEAFHRHGGADVAFVGVSVDSNPEAAAAAKREWGIPYDVTVDDGSMSRSYGIEVLPTFVVVGRDGTVHRVSTGTPSRSDLDKWLAQL